MDFKNPFGTAYWKGKFRRTHRLIYFKQKERDFSKPVFIQSTFSMLSVTTCLVIFCSVTFSKPVGGLLNAFPTGSVFSKTSSSLSGSTVLLRSISSFRPFPLSFVIRLVECLNFRSFLLAYPCSFLDFSRRPDCTLLKKQDNEQAFTGENDCNDARNECNTTNYYPSNLTSRQLLFWFGPVGIFDLKYFIKIF